VLACAADTSSSPRVFRRPELFLAEAGGIARITVSTERCAEMRSGGRGIIGGLTEAPRSKARPYHSGGFRLRDIIQDIIC
jgi:hypothetical protein